MIFGRSKRSMQTTADAFHDALQNGNKKAAAKALERLHDCWPEVRDNPEQTSEFADLMGYCLCTGHAGNIDAVVDVLPWYIEKFPTSVWPVRVACAAVREAEGCEDEATYLARDYLHDLHEANTLAKPSDNGFVTMAKGHAFHLLTSVYTKRVGARSYSRHVLNMAVQYPIHDTYRRMILAENERLVTELQEPAAAMQDRQWIEFFRCGANDDELHELCIEQECPLLADRVELLATNFRLDPNYTVTKGEVFQQVIYMEGRIGRPSKMLV